MSDFDDVLERLLTDAAFKAALAADPVRALTGYDLADDERDLLSAQVSTDTGGDRRVEARTTKAGLFGLLSPLTGGFGDGGIGTATGHAAATAAGHVAQVSGLTPGPGGVAGLVTPAPDLGHLVTPADDLSHLVTPVPAGGPGPLGGGVTALPGHESLAPAPGYVAPAPPPVDYHPHVDVDGDGRWDQYRVQTRSDGGLDLTADMDHDGRVDFVGHDDNRDGLIDRADYDTDRDGVAETHLSDTDGDGWLDRRWHG
jgi:hypothetical protein